MKGEPQGNLAVLGGTSGGPWKDLWGTSRGPLGHLLRTLGETLEGTSEETSEGTFGETSEGPRGRGS